MKLWVCYAILFSVLVFLVYTPSAWADATATLTGRVVDPRGLVVPNAKVEAVNVATGVHYPGQSNSEGYYNIVALPPGTYHVLVEKPGFKTIDKTDVILHVEDVVALNFNLEVGSVAETITVTGGAPVINTESGAVSTVVDRKYVENIPLNGRSFQDLILLAPGVVTNNPQTRAGGGSVGEFSVSGQRTESNSYSVDGVSANIGIGSLGAFLPATSGSLPPATSLGTTQGLLSVDAMEEFRIQTSTYSAEYGRNPGGQFSFVTRSGTNQWHGTAFDYLRNDYFDANNWFNDYFGRPSPPLRQNDFGGTLGGPIRIPGLYNGKDKTFFFFSYEGLRLIQPQAAATVFVPSTGLRQSTPAPLQTVLKTLPLPNGADLGNGLAQFVSNWSNPSDLDSKSIRLDHVLNKGLRFFFRFSDTPSSSRGRNVGNPALVNASATTARTYTFGTTSSFSSRLANEFRLNYSSTSLGVFGTLDSFGGATAVDLFALQGIPGTAKYPNVAVVLSFGSNSSGAAVARSKGIQGQWNVVDTLSLTLGRHQFKFGIDFRRLTPNINPASPTLQYTYLSATAVQANSPFVVVAATTAAAFPIYTNFSAFAADEWKVTPRLNLSMGLRWEVNPAPGVTQGLMPYTVQGSSLSTLALAPQGTPLWNTSWYNFAPRLGAAYALRSTAGWESVIRGGVGVFFDTGQQLGSSGFSGPGFSATNLFGTAFGSPMSFPISPTQAPVIINPPVPLYPTTFAFSPHLQLPFTLQWNASIQQALGKAQALTVSYVGANGRRLLERSQVNVALFNPNFSTVVFNQNGLTADYDALELQFQRRFARGLQALASYTWSHSIDYGSLNTELPYLRGNSDFDVRHNFSGAFSYDLPNPFQDWFSRAVLHHWGVDDRFTARTGFPVTLNGASIFDPATGMFFHTGLNLVPGQPFYIPGPACTALYNNGKSCPGDRAINPLAFAVPVSGTAGNAPRNFVRGFGAWQMDLAIRREFPIYERLKLQFRAEAFNVFNHPNFGTINATTYCNPAFTPGCTFGQATSTLASSLGGLSPLYQMGGPRSMQFALKLMF